jgi:predicted transport protein
MFPLDDSDRILCHCHLLKFVLNIMAGEHFKEYLQRTYRNLAEIARDISNIGHRGNGDYEVKFRESNGIGYILSLVRQSYEAN